MPMRGFILGVVLLAANAFAADEQKMVFKVDHHYSVADARARTQMMLDYWKKAYGVRSSWDGDRVYISGRVIGVQIDAYIDVTPESVGGEGADPGPFMRGLARDYVQKKLQKYMHPDFREP
jgi:Putative polyhydroxyalkanoic acid system protein (PHA_gran_rgn)